MSVSSIHNFVRATTFPKEIPLAIKIEPELLNYVNFTDPKFVRFYCGRDSQEPQCIEDAIKIAKTVYETPLRQIRDNLGYSFPINPEVLGYAMKLAKHQTVLELGGARGENAMLFAFSEAREVYFNEIIPDEVQVFEEIKTTLPRQVQVKLKTVSGNCLELTKIYPELIGKVGMVFCRNFLHFFNDDEQLKIFEHLKKVMQPGAKGIFTVNSGLGYPQELYKQDPHSTAFWAMECSFHNNQIAETSRNLLFQDFSHCDPQLVGSRKDSLVFHYYEKKTGQPWKVNEQDFKKLPKIVRNRIKIDLNDPAIKKIQEGYVKIIHAPNRAYRPEQLSDLFQKQGFQILNSFATDKTGHTVSMDPKNWFNIEQIGVVVQYLGKGV